MDLEERISRLERDNRRLKRLLCALILLPLGVLPLIGAGREEKTDVLTVRELIIKDENDTMRGRIVAHQDSQKDKTGLAAAKKNEGFNHVVTSMSCALLYCPL
jgi:hypothetical protein